MFVSYPFGCSVILLLLVAVNIYFFYTFTALAKPQSIVPSKLELAPDNIFKEIYDHLYYLPSHYKAKNPNYLPVQQSLLQSFKSPIVTDTKSLWQDAENVSNTYSIF